MWWMSDVLFWRRIACIVRDINLGLISFKRQPKNYEIEIKSWRLYLYRVLKIFNNEIINRIIPKVCNLCEFLLSFHNLVLNFLSGIHRYRYSVKQWVSVQNRQTNDIKMSQCVWFVMFFNASKLGRFCWEDSKSPPAAACEMWCDTARRFPWFDQLIFTLSFNWSKTDYSGNVLRTWR